MLTSTSGIARRAPLLAVLAALALVGCAKQVTRIDPDSVTDLSGRWNDTDSRLVANALIEQSMVDPWIRRFNEAGLAGLAERPGRGRKPKIQEGDALAVVETVLTPPP